MGNDNDRTSIVTHVSKNIEQPVGFLWRQHCCRLIQDQNPCSTIQHLHNFNCLFFRNGHFVDFFGKVQIKTIFIDQFLNIFGYFFHIESGLTRQAQYNIFCCRKYIYQFEMLMYHTYS